MVGDGIDNGQFGGSGNDVLVGIDIGSSTFAGNQDGTQGVVFTGLVTRGVTSLPLDTERHDHFDDSFGFTWTAAAAGCHGRCGPRAPADDRWWRHRPHAWCIGRAQRWTVVTVPT